MKQIAMLLVMLFATFSAHGDMLENWDEQWEDVWEEDYQLQLSIIRNSQTPVESYRSALSYANECANYIYGFSHSSMTSGNRREVDSKRYADWGKEMLELTKQRGNFITDNKGDIYENLEQSPYYAREMTYNVRKLFELNCQYRLTLQRETEQAIRREVE